MSKTYGKTETTTITTYTYDEEGPEGTRYVDRTGDTWFREGHTWYYTRKGQERGGEPEWTSLSSWKQLIDMWGPLTEVPGPSQDQTFIIGEARGYFGLWVYDGDDAWRHSIGVYTRAHHFEPGWEEAILAPKKEYYEAVASNRAESINRFFSGILRIGQIKPGRAL